MKVLIYLFAMLLSMPAIAQVENEVGFKYIKAKYLVETERYEDAIKAFTDIIDKDGDYEEALMFRADAKYKMAAYSGAKNDAMEYIKNHGITHDAIVLLGKADYRLKRYDQALNSLESAAKMNSEDDEVYEILGDIYEEKGDDSMACTYWDKAAQMGSTTAYMNVQKKCNGQSRNSDVVRAEPKIKDGPSTKKEGGIIAPKGNTGGKLDTKDKEDTKVEAPSSPTTKTSDNRPKYDNMPPDDDYKNHIEIDDELSITVYGQGLGRRKVMDKPNILIISDTDGIVAVDVCVNSRGKVTSSELNTSESTLLKDHLVSLALRKAKEFWFEKSDFDKQCGVMLFHIESL